jgi:hypothetical protein
VLRVEEARRQPGRQRLAGQPGLHAGDRVAAIFEDASDSADVVRPGHPVQRGLRRVVGVQRTPVVLSRRLVQLAAGGLVAEQRDVLAEPHDVLLGRRAHRRQRLELTLLLASLRPVDDHRDHDADDDKQDQELHCRSTPSLVRRFRTSP